MIHWTMHWSLALTMVFGLGQRTLWADSGDGIHSQFERYVVEGRLDEGQRELKKLLSQTPDDDQTRFALGVTQFIGSVEHLAQALHRYGTGTHGALDIIPFFRMPVPANPSPDKVRYADVRRMFQNFIDDLAEADKTLQSCAAKSVKLRLPLGNVRLDINGNGQAEADELLWTIYAKLAFRQGQGNAAQATADQFVTMLDIGDVHWLRGYCNLLSAMCNTILMYDHQKFFDTIAPAIFAKPDVPTGSFFTNQQSYDYYADLIAGIHMAVFTVKEPQRGLVALEQLQNVLALSRKTWEAVLAETDNDREWIPNPKQNCVFPQLRVTEAMVQTWQKFLSEADDLLAGKKLAPHWRMPTERGINLRRVFTEPREFDLVMWVQGTGAIPFIEAGKCTERATWDQFQAVFGGRFIGFAMWFN